MFGASVTVLEMEHYQDPSNSTDDSNDLDTVDFNLLIKDFEVCCLWINILSMSFFLNYSYFVFTFAEFVEWERDNDASI